VSARAAWRLETLGFRHVYRYQPGKDDWWVARLPMEGTEAGTTSAADVARPDVPTCGLGDPVAEVARQVREGDWPLAVVVDERRIVLGRLRPSDLEAHPDATAAELIVDGPRTIRGTRPAGTMGSWLDERHVRGVLVTTADGELIGYLRREDVEGRETEL
jgi:CBS domain-containing protein